MRILNLLQTVLRDDRRKTITTGVKTSRAFDDPDAFEDRDR